MRPTLDPLRVTLRRLGRTPSWTAAVVATFALGLGAVTAVVTVVDGVLLRPLAFEGSERVVGLCETAERVRGFCVASPPNVADWARASRTIEAFGVARDWSFDLRRGEAVVPVRGGIATPGFFEVVRAPLALGRGLGPGDLVPGGEPAVLLAHVLWVERFGADPAVIGRAIEIDDRPARVVGVLAADAEIPDFEGTQLWLPLTAISDDVTNRGWRGFTAVGRLAPGATLDAARDEMARIRAELATAFPDTNRDWGLVVEPWRELVAGSARPPLVLLAGAAAALLLVACANVVHLLLARASGREGELAVRAALGATPAGLARLVAGDTLLLALAGGALGLALAAGAVPALLALAPAGLPRRAEIALDLRVFAWAAAATLAAAAASAAVPARRMRRFALTRALHGVRAGAPGSGRFRGLLVVAQVALALQLLVGAALLGRGFERFLSWSPGLATARLVPLWTSASPGRYRTGEEAALLFERLAAEARALPEVEAAALASAGPLFGGVETAEIALEAGGEAVGSVRWFDLSPGYFAALGVPFVAGRDFSATDDAAAPPVAIVNRAFEARFFGGASALGRRVVVDARALEIVGVVADVPPARPDRAAEPELSWPQRQAPRWGSFVLLRLAPGAALPARALAARWQAIDRDVTFGGGESLDRLFARRAVHPRFLVVLVAAFAALALLLAAIGTYGVLAYAVAARTRELGVRLALGAGPSRLGREVLARGLGLAGGGIALGLIGALAGGRLLEALLYGVAPADPLALTVATATLATAAVAAAALPARRAGATDPLAALRAD